MKKQTQLFMLAALACSIPAFCAETVLNDDFSTNAPGAGIPAGWMRYGHGPVTGKIAVEENGGKKLLHITDLCSKSETGITRTITVKPGKFYRLSCTVDFVNGAQDRPSLQLRFAAKPRDKVFNTAMKNGLTASVTGQAPGSKAQLYVWTLKPLKPDFTVRNVMLEVSDTPFEK